MEKILLIDDSSMVLATLEEILSPHYEIAKAADGLQGIELAETFCPNLILLDIKLPFVDGYDICRRLKEMPTTAESPVIFITGMGAETERVRGFEAGAEDYIVKPFYPQELLARVRIHLDVVKAKRQSVEMERLKLLREMAQSLSHRLFNPITAVYGCMAVLETEAGPLSDEARYSLSGMKEGLERIHDIIRRLSDAAHSTEIRYDSHHFIDFREP